MAGDDTNEAEAAGQHLAIAVELVTQYIRALAKQGASGGRP